MRQHCRYQFCGSRWQPLCAPAKWKIYVGGCSSVRSAPSSLEQGLRRMRARCCLDRRRLALYDGTRPTPRPLLEIPHSRTYPLTLSKSSLVTRFVPQALAFIWKPRSRQWTVVSKPHRLRNGTFLGNGWCTIGHDYCWNRWVYVATRYYSVPARRHLIFLGFKTWGKPLYRRCGVPE